MSNHTPGPWKVIVGCVYDARGVRIALMDRDERGTTPVERDVNARLIATAPKMKELLERAARRLQGYCAEANGDLNDSLTMEIYAFTEELDSK